MVKARVRVFYDLSEKNLLMKGKPAVDPRGFVEFLDELAERYNLGGDMRFEFGSPELVSINLFQEEVLLKRAFEDLVDSEARAPDNLRSPWPFVKWPWGGTREQGRLGFETAREVLAERGYSLELERYSPLLPFPAFEVVDPEKHPLLHLVWRYTGLPSGYRVTRSKVAEF
jgi:hypothetical protein